MPSGILLLDKPRGLSSNAALQRVKRAYGAAKAGHVGSLDPLATGMLPICLDEATKIAGEILAGRKRYEFTVAPGARTSTGDTEGEIVERSAVPVLDRTGVEAVLAAFHGVHSQVPLRARSRSMRSRSGVFTPGRSSSTWNVPRALTSARLPKTSRGRLAPWVT